ncbi:MAG: hypothetical protein FJ271_09100 [Planctomycetes bacterium]|nr:hypothetical protein [Planctomycetota bacterium]
MHHRLMFIVAFSCLTSAVRAQETQDARSLAARAMEYAKTKDFAQAVRLMAKAVELDPRNAELLGNLSELEFKAFKFADGQKHAEQAIALKPDVGKYYYLAGFNAYANQDLDKAREYSKILRAPDRKFDAAAVTQGDLLDDLLIDKTFTLFYKLDPKKGRVFNGALTVSLPRTGLPYQKTTYEISGVKSKRLVKGVADDVLHIVPAGREPMPLTIKVTLKPYSYKAELAKASRKPLPAEARSHLGAIVAINPKSPVLRKAVTGLKGADPLTTVRNIQLWMQKNIDYKLDKASFLEVDFKSVDEIVKRGFAECRGYAMLFAGLCRAADIPARPVWGLVRVPPGLDRKHGDIVSHNWAEVYISGIGWIPVDPQRPETLGMLPNYYLRMFTGVQRTATSMENLPLFNLLMMHDAQVMFKETR